MVEQRYYKAETPKTKLELSPVVLWETGDSKARQETPQRSDWNINDGGRSDLKDLKEEEISV